MHAISHSIPQHGQLRLAHSAMQNLKSSHAYIEAAATCCGPSEACIAPSFGMSVAHPRVLYYLKAVVPRVPRSRPVSPHIIVACVWPAR
jgi:hypothetical protein